MLSLFTKNAGAPKLLRFGTPTFIVEPKIIAKGEVVVIDESFGVRITDIIHPSKRL